MKLGSHINVLGSSMYHFLRCCFEHGCKSELVEAFFTIRRMPFSSFNVSFHASGAIFLSEPNSEVFRFQKIFIFVSRHPARITVLVQSIGFIV